MSDANLPAQTTAPKPLPTAASDGIPSSDLGLPGSPQTNTGEVGVRRNQLLRAVLYTPVILLLGTLAAIAKYPELTKYVAPIFGMSSGEHHCPLSQGMEQCHDAK